jgi:hypothetical protein
MTIRNTHVSRRAVLGGAAMAAAAPALAVNLPAGPTPRLLEAARAAFARHAARIVHGDFVAIADYSLHSASPRFFLYQPETGEVTALRVAHGRGSDPGHSGWLQRFSAQPGSAASSAGAYLTGAAYVGQHGRSRRLIGLDPENATAEARAIVIHGAWYCEPAVLQQTGKLGRSEGCFAFSGKDADLVLERLGPGRLLFSGRG